MIPSKNRKDEVALRFLYQITNNNNINDRRVLSTAALKEVTPLQNRLTDTKMSLGSISVLTKYVEEILKAIDIVLQEGGT